VNVLSVLFVCLSVCHYFSWNGFLLSRTEAKARAVQVGALPTIFAALTRANSEADLAAAQSDDQSPAAFFLFDWKLHELRWWALWTLRHLMVNHDAGVRAFVAAGGLAALEPLYQFAIAPATLKSVAAGKVARQLYQQRMVVVFQDIQDCLARSPSAAATSLAPVAAVWASTITHVRHASLCAFDLVLVTDAAALPLAAQTGVGLGVPARPVKSDVVAREVLTHPVALFVYL
jgi:hypothetical protein